MIFCHSRQVNFKIFSNNGGQFTMIFWHLRLTEASTFTRRCTGTPMGLRMPPNPIPFIARIKQLPYKISNYPVSICFWIRPCIKVGRDHKFFFLPYLGLKKVTLCQLERGHSKISKISKISKMCEKINYAHN